MTMALYMLKLRPDMRRLAFWAARCRLASPEGELGYALHAALTAAYGELAPKSFRLCGERTNGGCHGSNVALYGYTGMDAPALREHAGTFADPDVAAALNLDHLAVKAMPTAWAPGRRLGFDVRVRPVFRRDRGGVRDKTCERDVFQVAFDRAEAEALAASTMLVPPRRESVYAAWLAEQFARSGAARLVDDVRLVSFQRARVVRKGRPRAGGGRPVVASEGPDAVLSGLLEVTDGQAFAALLRRGIGRHRAFGFGMLLLRPAGAAPPPC